MQFTNLIKSLALLATSAEAISIARPCAALAARAYDCSNNGGTPLCCQGTFAGDLPAIIALADATGYQLDPNDVNCFGTSPASPSCVGTNVCCQQTAVDPVVGLYCQKPVGA